MLKGICPSISLSMGFSGTNFSLLGLLSKMARVTSLIVAKLMARITDFMTRLYDHHSTEPNKSRSNSCTLSKEGYACDSAPSSCKSCLIDAGLLSNFRSGNFRLLLCLHSKSDLELTHTKFCMSLYLFDGAISNAGKSSNGPLRKTFCFYSQ